MNEQTKIKPLEQAYYDECGTERTDKDRPNYKHWLEQRVTQLEAEIIILKKDAEPFQAQIDQAKTYTVTPDLLSGE